ncbi:bifunctional folylpolyglutamate synthase/dihydrofolate synthase [Capnocytophaga sputigena]|uniref:Dihydrofolate synthase/folylpolyglutamate synthase n=1 Tax=Capnocytophaga sputigena TaxID=1019 RepID=A0AAX2IES7_CAPSP|nr:folylpolyglutamate synthase/dihydrofolate synthase family protein [Capnocytophaga sputigena]ATA83027.1 bifunctional folylpolyglutamate synthase/dihydrofolate synthase [Capnocytophaga sputigena]EEB66465.1 bifunctional protein FolC [Capnocytophaga sputigena ATCC 33612]SQA76652.1 Folylpolyglutamate synthase [Capnocytophaga sputigena]
MNYQETLSWMFNRLPMFQTQGKNALNNKLDNILTFTSALGNPQTKFKSLHIAGTNGKGSSSSMLASILQEAGYKVGLYTSPHLKDFRERIKIDGKEIPESYVVNFITKNKSFLEEHSLSFFEMTVGMAFSYFAEEKVDIAVIEVGLGGRFDSTNIITPEVSLITNISKDHTDILGDTLPKIAFEKAGIIKQNVPVVISEYQEETAPVFTARAKEIKAPIIFANHIETSLTTDLQGAYQEKNIKGVIAVIELLIHQGWDITPENIAQGLLHVVHNTNLKGRWQTLGSYPTIVCDTGHNVGGLTYVMEQLKKQTYTNLHIVVGFVKEKDVNSVLELFPKEATYYFCSPAIARGLNVNTLKEIATAKGLQGEAYSSVAEALNVAKAQALPTDFIFVGGSTFVVAEVV